MRGTGTGGTGLMTRTSERVRRGGTALTGLWRRAGDRLLLRWGGAHDRHRCGPAAGGRPRRHRAGHRHLRARAGRWPRTHWTVEAHWRSDAWDRYR